MSNLSDKLKSLGVKVGVAEIHPNQPIKSHPIEHVMPGQSVDTPSGTTYLVEQVFHLEEQPWLLPVQPGISLQHLAAWSGDADTSQLEGSRVVFLDTETSGLAGGTGTFVFMVGVGRFEVDGYHLLQFFMRDPTEEPALLMALEEYLTSAQTVVTFNGKSFDIPMLNTRYILQGWRSPFGSLAHIDLLHLARKLWRQRLPSRTLGNLEVAILGIHRTEEEVPGWMVPQIYFDYLRTGDARPIKNVFYHNSVDVLSLASMLYHITWLLQNPLLHAKDESLDQSSLGQFFENLGETTLACQLYQASLDQGMPEDSYWDTLRRYSFLLKRLGHHDQAVQLWEKAASQFHIYAHIELAKVHEHLLKDNITALQWTQAALDALQSKAFPQYERQIWQPELEHRRERLARKIRLGSENKV
jgi:uncharacterized protein YprB with RNaseH-like and TPR domain